MQHLLKNKDYLFLWLAQFVSGLGDVFYTVGILVTIFETTGSALQTAGVMVATTLPPFLLGPIAGALVDRYPRQWVMVTMDVVRVALVAFLWSQTAGDTLNVWVIYLVVGGLASATAFYVPARQALIPTLVPEEQIVRANGVIISTTQATMALGFIIGGFLILRLDLQDLILIDLFTFIVGGLLVSMIRPKYEEQKDDGTGAPPVRVPLWRSIREGAGYLRRHPVARPLVIMEVFEHIPHGIWTSALMLVFVERALNGTPDDWGYQSAAYFSGMIVGAVLASIAVKQVARRPGWIIIVNAFLAGVMTLIYANSPTNLFAIVVAFIFGPPFAIRDVAQDSLLQSAVEKRMLGRIYAMRSMFLNLNFMLAGLFFAWLADIISIRSIYMIGAGLYVCTALYALSSQALRTSRIAQTRVVEEVVTAVESPPPS